MDLSDFEMSAAPVFVQLRHPKTDALLFMQKDGKDDPNEPIGGELYSSDSDQFKKHRRKITDKTLEARQKNKFLKAAELDDDIEASLADCIASLRNVVWKGETLNAPKDTRRFIKLMPWAARQFDEAMSDVALFMPALAKN